MFAQQPSTLPAAHDLPNQNLAQRLAFPIIVTLDGPASSGKSAVGIELARKYNAPFLDSGLLYRCVGLLAFEGNIDPTNAERLTAAAAEMNVELPIGIDSGSSNTIKLNGVDVTEMLSRHAVSDLASKVSVHPGVRASIDEVLRQVAHQGCIVAGRDMGTNVFKDVADVKFHLTASLLVRTIRRLPKYTSFAARNGYGNDGALYFLAADIQERDNRDTSKEQGALLAPEDPRFPTGEIVVVDTTDRTIAETLQILSAEVDPALANAFSTLPLPALYEFGVS